MSRHLMARMKRTSGSLFDWQQKYREPDLAWHVKTETGHVLTLDSPEVMRGAGREIAARGPDGTSDVGWHWQIHDLNDPDPAIQDYSWNNHSNYTAHLKGGLIHAPEHGTDPTVYSGDHIPTFDAAAAQAEKAFLERFRGGSGHQRVSPVNYEDLVNPRDDLDGDFGDIFGEGR
jgi:hypothetical protein